MPKLPLTLASTHYEHLSELMTGRIPVEGIDLTCLEMQVEEVFFRFLNYREFDVAEMSLAKYAAMVSQGQAWMTAIPVFPHRMFRHSSLYIRRDRSIHRPADLAGRRVGVPEWAETAAVYARGALAHQYGVDLRSIEWVQAGVNDPGRTEKVKLNLPPGLNETSRPDKSLNDMLVDGEIDAIIAAHAPMCFENNDPNIGRLFDNFVEVETQYYRKTGIYPIMHVVVIRNDVVERNPWIVMNLYKAFEEAKRRSYYRLSFRGPTPYMDPWAAEHARRREELFGPDYYPYGIEPNLKTLDAFLQYCSEQGVCHRRVQVEELFAKQVQQHFRV